LITRDKLPAVFSNVIPDSVSELAAAVYDDSEKAARYPEVQKEIAIKLL